MVHMNTINGGGEVVVLGSFSSYAIHMVFSCQVYCNMHTRKVGAKLSMFLHMHCYTISSWSELYFPSEAIHCSVADRHRQRSGEVVFLRPRVQSASSPAQTHPEHTQSHKYYN